MPKLVLFRCRRFALDDVAKVVEVDDLDGVVRELADDKPVVVLIGAGVSASVASAAINAAAASGAFLFPSDSGLMLASPGQSVGVDGNYAIVRCIYATYPEIDWSPSGPQPSQTLDYSPRN